MACLHGETVNVAPLGQKNQFPGKHYLTIGGTLWHWALATSTADTDTVDNIALLGLVTQTACLIRTRWAGSTVDDVQLSKLYYALSAKFNECIARSIRRCPHSIPRPQYSKMSVEQIRSIGSGFEVAKGSIYLTSQHRTRRRKRRTSDCFFFCNSSTYLRAPICERDSQQWVAKIWYEIFDELEFGSRKNQNSRSRTVADAVTD